MSTIGEHPTEALLDGRYHLGPCIGRGGTAVVYRAEDRSLGRTVAVKLLRQGADETPSDTERAHREVGVLAGLNHPSLVTLYDARLDPGHPRYLAMEYVDGPTLAARLDKGVLSREEAAALAHDVARALQVVHAAGVVHRDVKPSNVLLAPPLQAGRRWTAKLTDFGIAHEVEDARSTSPGIIIGTAAYMAPEQVRAEELTPAVDIYSLGLVLIESLAGEPAFPICNGIQTALSRLTNEPAIPESIDEEWRELLTWMTRAEPSARPSADRVAEAAAALMGDASGRTDTAPALPLPLLLGGSAEEPGAAAPPATREYPTSSVASPGGRRGLRYAAVAAAGVIAVSAAVISWSASLSSPPATRLVTFVQDSPSPVQDSPQPDASDVASDDAVEPDESVDATTAGTDAQSPQEPTSVQNQNSAPNPNKGPGNNSGNGSGSDRPPKGNGHGR